MAPHEGDQKEEDDGGDAAEVDQLGVVKEEIQEAIFQFRTIIE